MTASPISPRAADAIRKVVGYSLAAGITLLLFRVLGRLAQGTQTLRDPEWIVLAVLMTLAILWVRAAKRVRRAGASEQGEEAPVGALGVRPSSDAHRPSDGAPSDADAKPRDPSDRQ